MQSVVGNRIKVDSKAGYQRQVMAFPIESRPCCEEEEETPSLPPPGRKGIDDLVGGCIESTAPLLHPLFMLEPSSSEPSNEIRAGYIHVQIN